MPTSEVAPWLVRAANARPDVVAVETPAGSCSYGELLAASSVAARSFSERGIGAGHRVAIALPPGLDFAYALHACLLLGAIAVPIDLRLSAVEQEKSAAGAAVLVGQRFFYDLDLRSAGRGDARPVKEAAPASHDLNATAVLIHTSGTSAAPKPIELTYGNLLWSALGSAVALGLDQQERWLCALPLSHVGGLSILVRSAIYGTTAVVHERFETDRVLHALREGEITLVSLVATTLARLLDAGLEHPPELRCALTGGGPVPAALVERASAAGVPVSMTYGLTESCSQATTTPLAAIAVGDLRAGPPLFCTRVRCEGDDHSRVRREGDVRADGGREPDVEGEILVAGPTVAPGALAPDGWLHTGDLGTLDEHGRLQVTGRKADTIVSGGENVAPSEVEAVLATHPDVLEAAVVGRPDERWGEAVTAIVVLRDQAAQRRPEAPANEAALRTHCAASLAPYKVPKRVEFRVEPLPRTRSGKLLRREL